MEQLGAELLLCAQEVPHLKQEKHGRKFVDAVYKEAERTVHDGVIASDESCSTRFNLIKGHIAAGSDVSILHVGPCAHLRQLPGKMPMGE